MRRIKRRQADSPTTKTRAVDWDDFADTALHASLVFGAIAGGIGLFAWYKRKEAERIRAASVDESLADAAEDTELDPAVVEAAGLLGIPPTASRAEVRAALRARVADGNHPDNGGEADLTRRLIAARDLLLAHLDHTEQI